MKDTASPIRTGTFLLILTTFFAAMAGTAAALERKWGATGPAQGPAITKEHRCVFAGIAAQRGIMYTTADSTSSPLLHCLPPGPVDRPIELLDQRMHRSHDDPVGQRHRPDVDRA